jgi:hypothetical protein
MEKQPQPQGGESRPPRRAPYHPPRLRDHGSIQSITQAQFIHAARSDGAGGGGKTNV